MLTENINESIEFIGKPRPSEGLFSHPLEFDCHYTPIKISQFQLSKPPNQYFGGYNFYASKGIEACNNTIACCLTAYNEPLADYLVSLNSLAACAEYFRIKGEERVSRELIICIIVDGFNKMSSGFARWAEKLGIFQPNRLTHDADFHMFESLVPRENLLKNEAMEFDKSIPRQLPLQRVILFIKTENRGKLDSHRCFFDCICGYYSAKYFVQIDVGTSPHKDALYHMWAELQAKPNVAATAARSLLPWPDRKFDLLKLWQYCDIAVERIVNWPSEIFLGNLSVLPGQLSLTRIASVLETADHAPNTENCVGVLDRYYRGLSQLGPFESNMYLAEDRILGQEMVFQKNSTWELSYETDAEAVVDACDTWSELCRQRRRWICSSMACRFALLGKLPKILANKKRVAHERLHKILAATYFLIYSVCEWCVPAIYLMLQTAIVNTALSQNNPYIMELFLKMSIPLLIVTTGILSLIAWKGNVGNSEEILISSSLYAQTLILAGNTFILLMSKTNAWLLSTMVISVILYVSIAACYSKELARKIASAIVQYMFMRLPIKSFLMTYSIFNAHDTSWGTKGLNTPSHKGDLESIRKTFKRFRMVAISLFVVSNSALYYVAYSHNFLSKTNIVYILFSVLFIQLSIAMIALAYSKSTQRRKLR